MKNLIVLALLLINVSLFAQDDWQILSTDNYSIQYPKDWTSSDQKPQPSVQFLLLSDESSLSEDNFRENINMTIENLKGKSISIDEYVKISIDQISAQIPNAKIITNESTKIDGNDAKEVIWSADFGNNMVLKFKQILLINSDSAYILTYSSTVTEFSKYEDIGDKILQSFKLAK